MVEPILHLIIPVLILLAFKPSLDKKLVFGLLILTILPDFDYFVGHRSIFHNILFVILFSFVVYLLFRFIINRNKNEKENKNAFYLSLYYLFFHLLLDISLPGVPLLYPFTTKLFTLNFDLIARSFGNGTAESLVPKLNIITQPITEATKYQDVWIATTLGILLLVIVAIFLIITFLNKKKQFLKKW